MSLKILGGVANNCTIFNNIADSYGCGIYAGTMINTIVYYNSRTNGTVSNLSGVYTATYCCSPNLRTGTGNITTAPRFADRAGGDGHLQADSPCINAGDNTAVSGETDLDGNPRIFGGIVDIGAYECEYLQLSFFLAFSPDFTLDFEWTERSAGTVYIQANANITNSVWENITNLPSVEVGETNSVIISPADEAYMFYRIFVEP